MEMKQRRTLKYKLGQRILGIALMLVIILTGASTLQLDETEAATSPGVVPNIRATNITSETAKIIWKKAKGTVSGYTLYRNGKAVKNFNAKTFSHKETGLEASKTYKYRVKAYTYKKKVRQWYNKETKKWQSSKPAANIRGKSRLVRIKKYGKASPVLSVKTKENIVIEGRVVKPSQFTEKNNFTISFMRKGTECSVCGEGVKITIHYDPASKKFNTSADGIDYSKKCHHHDSFAITACNGDHHHKKADIRSKCRWFRDSDGREVNPKTGAVIGTQTIDNHSDNFPQASVDELSSMKYDELLKIYPDPRGDGKSVKCQGNLRFTSYKFCRDCRKILP